MSLDPVELEFTLARANAPNEPHGDDRWHALADAHMNRQRLLAVADVAVPEGFVVTLAAPVLSAWLPRSQAVTGMCEVGAVIEVQVLAFRRGSGEVIVSQRLLLETYRARAQAEEWQRLALGQQREARVVAVLPFGAFVDVGRGIQAMLHEPGARFTEGQVLPVEVIKIDLDTRRVMVKRTA